MRHVLKAVLTVLVLAVSAVSVAPGLADPEERPVVTIAYTEFAPYSFTDENGVGQGLSIDLARLLVEADGRELRTVLAPNPEAAIKMLESGAADISGLLGLSDARAARVLHTSQLNTLRIQVFAKDAGVARLPDDFAGQRIGIVGGSIGMTLADAIPFAQVVTVRNIDDLALAMLTERVDAVIAPTGSFQSRLRLMGVDPMVEAVEPLLAALPMVIYVRGDWADLQASLQAQIDTALTDKKLDALAKRWFGTPTPQIERAIIIWGGLALVALSLGVVLALRRSLIYKSAARKIEAETEEYRLLIDALNGIDAAIVIYDESLRAIHWNNGYLRAFPAMMDSIKRGTSFRQLVVDSYKNGSLAETKTRAEAEQSAEQVILRMQAGENTRRLVTAASGQVYEASEFRVGKNHYASVRVDMTRLYGQAQLIKVQKRKLEAANEQLQRFSLLAAHDLKAPLQQQTTLLEFVAEDMAEADQTFPEDLSKHLNTVGTLSQRMMQLVEDLLEYAQTDQQVQAPRQLHARERVDAMLPLAGVPDSFTVDVADDLPIVTLSPTAFDTVLRNLISNAVKHHTGDNGQISIRGHFEPEFAVIEVADDGPGIPVTHLARIFEPFQRLSTKTEGSGLGLSFIQNTVNAWGGEISVSCPATGGSVFRFTIPRVPAPHLEAPLVSNGLQPL